MCQVILAFESQANCDRLREVLESSGGFSCIVCRSADQVRRTVRKLRLSVVVCGFKLGDESCEALSYDLPQRCSMLMIAPQARLRGGGDLQAPGPGAPLGAGGLGTAAGPAQCRREGPGGLSAVPGGAGAGGAGQGGAHGPLRHDGRAGPPFFAKAEHGRGRPAD